MKLNKYSKAIKDLVSLSETYRLEIAQNSIPWRIISPPFMNKSPIKIELFKIVHIEFLVSNFYIVNDYLFT